ncbi:hypothetical protein AKO1_012870 [Acrasis kona]|uniref:Uncharacterized protein n=1 Tax=Acrasis kona TaxID=1008807 RepID=A0AAW2YXU8_9EUKA
MSAPYKRKVIPAVHFIKTKNQAKETLSNEVITLETKKKRRIKQNLIDKKPEKTKRQGKKERQQKKQEKLRNTKEKQPKNRKRKRKDLESSDELSDDPSEDDIQVIDFLPPKKQKTTDSETEKSINSEESSKTTTIQSTQINAKEPSETDTNQPTQSESTESTEIESKQPTSQIEIISVPDDDDIIVNDANHDDEISSTSSSESDKDEEMEKTKNKKNAKIPFVTDDDESEDDETYVPKEDDFPQINQDNITISTTTSSSPSTPKSNVKRQRPVTTRKSMPRYYDLKEETSATTFGHKRSFEKACVCCASIEHTTLKCPVTFCKLCSRRGHNSNKCIFLKAGVCEWCRKYGHKEDECMLKQFIISEEAANDGTVMCCNCGQVGHLNCHKPMRRSNYCFNCGREHFGFECEQPTLEEFNEKYTYKKKERRRY